jgi:hypothetical protein
MGVVMLAGFLDVQNFPPFVVATLGASPMRHLALVAVRTFRKCMALERIMSAPISGACFRVSPFWIWHLGSFCLWAQASTLVRFPQIRMKSVFQLAAQILQRRPTGIFHRFSARTLLQVQIRPAVRAKTFTVLAADDL